MQRDVRRHTTNGREVENNLGEDRLEGVAVPEPTDLEPQNAPGGSPRWEGGETRLVTNHFDVQRDDDDLDDDDDDDVEEDLILGDEDELDEDDEDEVADVEIDDELDEDDIDEDDLFIDADDDEDEDDDLV